jgi:DNA-binding transcriptional LysR family regulator
MGQWDDIRIFLATARNGSFSEAARSLHVSQPTVSRRIAGLEDRLSATLFVRRTDGVSLTDAGRAVWQMANQMEAETLAIQRRIQGLDMRLTGTVRISVTEGLGVYWLTPRLCDFQRENPGITLEILTDNTIADLPRGEADIALRLGPPEHPDLVGRRVGYLSLGLFAAKSYLDAFGEPTGREQLRYHKIVDFTSNYGNQDGNLWRCLVDRCSNISYRTNNSIANFMAIRIGFGIGLLPIYMKQLSGQMFPDLKLVLPDWLWPDQEIWLVYHKDTRKIARVRALAGYIKELYKTEGEMFKKQIPEPRSGTLKTSKPAASIVARKNKRTLELAGE